MKSRKQNLENRKIRQSGYEENNQTEENKQSADYYRSSNTSKYSVFGQGQDDIKFHLENLTNKIDNLEQKLESKRRKVQHRHLPIREPAKETIYHYLMSLKKPKNYTYFAWSRNRISITLLFFLGLRANELINFSKKMLNDGITYGKVQIFQSKKGQYKVVIFSPELIKKLKNDLQKDIQNVFKKDTHVLGSSCQYHAKVFTTRNWARALNSFIQPAAHNFNEVLCSHSFRKHYITQLLRKLPIQVVKNVVGHKSIATTQIYDRYIVDIDQMAKVIDQAIYSTEQNENPEQNDSI